MTKSRPAVFRALGNEGPPPEILVDGQTYRFTTEFKHDSWAATAVYESGAAEQIVCKFNRNQSVLFVPLSWGGRWLARREAFLLTHLSTIGNLPKLLGPVIVDGRPVRHAIARSYVEGRPLMPREWVNDEFFPKLTWMIEKMHDLGVAYVDLHKCENIIIGNDGLPNLIDFQISYRQPDGWWWRLLRPLWFLKILQQCDRYHVKKLILMSRPDLLPEDQRNLMAFQPWPIRLARFFGDRLRWCRRKLLVLTGIRSGRGQVDTEVNPEDAVRRIMEARESRNQ